LFLVCSHAEVCNLDQWLGRRWTCVSYGSTALSVRPMPWNFSHRDDSPPLAAVSSPSPCSANHIDPRSLALPIVTAVVTQVLANQAPGPATLTNHQPPWRELANYSSLSARPACTEAYENINAVRPTSASPTYPVSYDPLLLFKPPLPSGTLRVSTLPL